MCSNVATTNVANASSFQSEGMDTVRRMATVLLTGKANCGVKESFFVLISG